MWDGLVSCATVVNRRQCPGARKKEPVTNRLQDAILPYRAS
jgi:hypothetical protein